MGLIIARNEILVELEDEWELKLGKRVEVVVDHVMVVNK